MNICIISGTFPDMKCGVGDYTYWLCSELKKYEDKISLITSNKPDIIPFEGIDLRPIIKKWTFPDVRLLIKTLKDIKPDIVHLQYPTQAYKNRIMINFFPIIFKHFFPAIPFIVTIHDAKTAHPLNKLRMTLLLFSSEKIIVTAQEEKDYLIDRFPFVKSKIDVIFIGSNILPKLLSIEERKKIRLQLGIEKNGILISNFGYILPKKKVEIIFYVLKSLLKKGYKARLCIISDFNSEKNKYHAKLKLLIERLGLSQYVTLTGYLSKDEASKYLLATDICIQVYPDGVSFRRGSFLAPLCHGLPIITTVVEKLPEGLKQNHNLIAVPPGDIEELTKAIENLILSEELRNKLANNAKLFSEQFGWGKIASEHISLYKRVLSTIYK